MQVQYQIFESSVASWDSLFEEVARFASDLGPKRLIGISQSESPHANGVVTVWYWDKEPQGA